MSTSVYPVVGRIRRNYTPEQQQDGCGITVPNSLCSITVPSIWLGTKPPEPSDFEFMYPENQCPDYPDNVLSCMYDNYPLFSWLADIRGTCQPRSDYVQRKELAEWFIDWIGNAPGLRTLTQTPMDKNTMKTPCVVITLMVSLIRLCSR